MSDNLGEQYNEDYFIRGKETGKSLYENYRWLPKLTIPMCEAIVKHCGIVGGDTILDFGCARGYTVKALRQLGHFAYGYDISKWAIENCDKSVSHYLTCINDIVFNINEPYGWVIAKDVLEHVTYVESYINKLMSITRKGLFVVVPLSTFYRGRYVIEEYEKDVTHIQRMPLYEWVKMFLREGWRVEASYRVPGVKDNYYKKGWEKGNGFITCRRIEE